MKIMLFALPALFAASAFAQSVIPMLTVEVCSGGTSATFVQVALETGKTRTIERAEITIGKQKSAPIAITKAADASPEEMTYVDKKTQGKLFRLTYDTVHQGSKGSLVYKNKGTIATIPSLTCNRTRDIQL